LSARWGEPKNSGNTGGIQGAEHQKQRVGRFSAKITNWGNCAWGRTAETGKKMFVSIGGEGGRERVGGFLDERQNYMNPTWGGQSGVLAPWGNLEETEKRSPGKQANEAGVE